MSGVTAAEKAAILSHYRTQAALASDSCLYGPALGHLPSATEVSSQLTYDAATGVFDRRNRSATNTRKVGTVSNKGYLRIKIAGRYFMSHRLAWLLSYGCWPEGQIDHINCNKLDNRIANLRCVTNAINAQNRRTPKASNKASGLLGVVRAERGKWRAVLCLNGKKYRFGRFDTPEHAHEAYVAGKRLLHAGSTL